MPMLHLIGGEKGGVGKSFVARTIVQYHLDRDIDLTLFDADRSNPDVRRIYKNVGCREAVFSENTKYEDKAQAVYLSVMKKQTIVNLPAQIIKPLIDWFEDNRIFDMAVEDRVEFTSWFVCNGGYDSLKLFNEYLNYFRDRVNHVLVKNWGLCDEWDSLYEDSLMEKIDDYGVKIIDFPRLKGNACRNEIDKQSMTFGAARESKQFNRIERQRIKTFLAEAATAFENAGVFYQNCEDFSSLDFAEPSNSVAQEAAAI